MAIHGLVKRKGSATTLITQTKMLQVCNPGGPACSPNLLAFFCVSWPRCSALPFLAMPVPTLNWSSTASSWNSWLLIWLPQGDVGPLGVLRPSGQSCLRRRVHYLHSATGTKLDQARREDVQICTYHCNHHACHRWRSKWTHHLAQHVWAGRSQSAWLHCLALSPTYVQPVWDLRHMGVVKPDVRSQGFRRN